MDELHLHGPPSPWASSAAGMFNQPMHHLHPPALATQPLGSRGSFAYVQLVVASDTHDTAKRLWRAVAMARAIRRLSRYPLLLLTNVMELPDGSNLVRRLAALDVHVLPLSSLEAKPRSDGSTFWKMHLWQITGFEKLIWLHTNGVLFHSIDWLFEHDEAIVALDDDSACSGQEQKFEGKGTLLLLQPNGDTFAGLQEMAKAADETGIPRTEDDILADYFAQKRSPLKVLSPTDAAAGACINASLSKEGMWRMPAYVYGSSDLDRCFYFDTAAQVVKASGTEVNVCHFHPLGPYWRDLFCEAVRLLAVQTGLVQSFCDDAQWYNQQPSPEERGEVSENARRKPFEICNAGALPPLSDVTPAIFEVSEEENKGCFDYIAGSDQKEMTKGGRQGRNWCWQGMKEYGCHWHLWEHMSWPQMQAEAFKYGNGTIDRSFHPLQNREVCDAQQFGAAQEFSRKDWASARQWFADMVAVFVLTLPSSTKRAETIRRHLGALGIDFTVVNGFDLRQDGDYKRAVEEGIIPQEFNITRAQEEAMRGNNDMGYIAGTVGCASGHFRVQQHATRHRPARPISLIFEDDVAPEKDFVPRLWRLVTEEVPCDWSAVSLRSGCPYGSCLSPQLSLVLPDANEPSWRCRHGVNYGFQGMLYRTAHIMEMHKLWKPVVYNESQPHCLDVDVALATLSDRIRYYAVPAVQAPGFLKETGQGSERWDINQAKKVLDKADTPQGREQLEQEAAAAQRQQREDREAKAEARKREKARREAELEEALAKQLEEREKQLERMQKAAAIRNYAAQR